MIMVILIVAKFLIINQLGCVRRDYLLELYINFEVFRNI